MTQILVLRSAATGDASASNRLITRYVAALTKANPGATVVERDLDADPLPHVTHRNLAGIGRAAPENAETAPTRAVADALIAELMASDVVVVGVPMYNFGMPTTLKTWFDYVLRAGTTFRYTANGPEGLVQGKRAVIVASTGGFYHEGPAAGLDHAIAHARLLLNFMGITEVETVVAGGMGAGGEKAEQSLQAAEAELARLASGRVPA